MEIKRDRMVFLGYGKYWRSDGIVGLMPIEDDRGPKRRTNVFVEGRAEPLVASRTEQSILEDMGASESGFQTQALRDAITELLGAFHDLSPLLRRALLHQHHFAAGNEPVVDVDVDGLAHFAVELHHGALAQL